MRNLFFSLLLYGCTAKSQPVPREYISTRCDTYVYGALDAVRYGHTTFNLTDSSIVIQGKRFLLRPGSVEESDGLITKHFSFEDKGGHTVTVILYIRQEEISGIALMHGIESHLYYITNLKTL